jgi:hypothetical protein
MNITLIWIIGIAGYVLTGFILMGIEERWGVVSFFAALLPDRNNRTHKEEWNRIRNKKSEWWTESILYSTTWPFIILIALMILTLAIIIGIFSAFAKFAKFCHRGFHPNQ